jgi:2'-5' RNA ligase
MSRVFAALHIPDDAIEQIIDLRNKLYPDDKLVRWESKSKLHITLKFLGELPPEKNNDILNGLENVIKDYSALNLAFNKFGIFRHRGKPKIVWAGLKPNDTLLSVVNDINSTLKNIGFENEKRKFHPHLTLLRIRGKEKMELINKFENYNYEEIKFVGNKISLFESRLLSGGSEYKILKSFELN